MASRIIKHDRYRIHVRAERVGRPAGYVAYATWKNGDDEFEAQVRSPEHGLGRFPTRDEAIAAAKARCDEINGGEPFQTVLAAYCPGPFYMGWHLYLREKADGRRNSDGGWGWEQGAGGEECGVRDLVKRLGHTPPPPTSTGFPSDDAFKRWFAVTFPLGIRVIVGEFQKLIPLSESEQRRADHA